MKNTILGFMYACVGLAILLFMHDLPVQFRLACSILMVSGAWLMVEEFSNE